MLGLVPIRGELVGSTDVDGVVRERECLSRLEPGFECLRGELLSSSIEQSAPSFVGGQRHVGRAGNRGGGAKLARRVEKAIA